MNDQDTRNRNGRPVADGGRLARFVAEIMAGLAALHRVQFGAPWDRIAPPRGR